MASFPSLPSIVPRLISPLRPTPNTQISSIPDVARHKVDDDPRRRAVLEVNPTSALLPPNGRVPIEVTFCPREEKFHNFNLIFNVRKKQTKLSINVKGEGFKVRRDGETRTGEGRGGFVDVDLAVAVAFARKCNLRGMFTI